MTKESGYRFEHKDSDEQHSIVVTLEEDVSVYKVVDALKALLLAAGFHMDTVDRIQVVDKSD